MQIHPARLRWRWRFGLARTGAQWSLFLRPRKRIICQIFIWCIYLDNCALHSFGSTHILSFLRFIFMFAMFNPFASRCELAENLMTTFDSQAQGFRSEPKKISSETWLDEYLKNSFVTLVCYYAVRRMKTILSIDTFFLLLFCFLVASSSCILFASSIRIVKTVSALIGPSTFTSGVHWTSLMLRSWGQNNPWSRQP